MGVDRLQHELEAAPDTGAATPTSRTTQRGSDRPAHAASSCRKHLVHLGSALLKPFVVITPDGRYSLSKLAALDHFRRTASWFRIAGILLLSPLPCLVIVLLIECIPLADPALGWRSSGMFQLRAMATNLAITTLSIYGRYEHLHGFKLTWKRALFFSVCVSVTVSVTNAIIMTAADIFPVPFTQFTAALPAFGVGRAIHAVYERIAVSAANRATSHESRDRERRQRTVQSLQNVQMLPMVVYPMYAAAFSQLSASQQLWFSLLLVAMRPAVRFMQWRVAHEDEDLTGVVLSASGHLFHVLFTLTCLQNAKSIDTLVVVLAFSTLQMLLNCRLLVRGKGSSPASNGGGDELSAAL